MIRRASIAVSLLLPAALVGHAAEASDVPAIVPFVEATPTAGAMTGAYAGAAFGYAFARDHGVMTTGTPGLLTLTPNVVPSTLDLEADGGFVASLHAGTNIAISDRFIIGGEVDVTFGQLSADGAETGTVAAAGTTLRTSAEVDMNWLGTARARAGVMALDNVHLYGTAGLAFGQVDIATKIEGVARPALMWEGSQDDIEVGYVVGAGAEYALGPNVSLRTEYLYYNLGDVSIRANGNGAVRADAALNGIDYVSETPVDGHILRGGLNLRLSSLF